MPDDEQAVGAIDPDLLQRIGARLRGSHRFESVTYRPEYAPDSVIAEFELGYVPAAVERTYLRIRWFETEEFNIHYTEQYGGDSQWECRWDRHPNEHDTRDHFHPPPDAATPGDDAEYPDDWREVLSGILTELDERIGAFWE